MRSKTSGTPSLHPGGSSPLRTGGRSFKGSVFTLVIHCTRARGGTPLARREASSGTNRPQTFPHIQPARVISIFFGKESLFKGCTYRAYQFGHRTDQSASPPAVWVDYKLIGARRVRPRLNRFSSGSLDPRYLAAALFPSPASFFSPVLHANSKS